MSSQRPFPTHYEPCLVCGYDHVHDLPRLSPHDRAEADAAHHAADWSAIDDAVAATLADAEAQ